MASLSGKRVVITRPAKQSLGFIKILSDLNAIPINFPTIEIVPSEDNQALDEAITNLEQYNWLVLTSQNAVDTFWLRLEAMNVNELPASLKVACIGPKTELALNLKGIESDYVPSEYVAEAILAGLGNLDGLKVLIPSSELARPELSDAIRNGGGIVDAPIAYHIRSTNISLENIAEIKKGVDVITFSSPSTADNFSKLVQSAGLDPLNLSGSPITACIGPITAKAAQKRGFNVDVIPADYTIESLVKALQNYYEEIK